jgi:hypothetical protein
LWEELRLRFSENRVLRRIFGSKKDEETGEWRKQHNESLVISIYHHIFFRVTKSRRMNCAARVTCIGEERCVQGFVGNPKGKRPFG